MKSSSFSIPIFREKDFWVVFTYLRSSYHYLIHNLIVDLLSIYVKYIIQFLSVDFNDLHLIKRLLIEYTSFLSDRILDHHPYILLVTNYQKLMTYVYIYIYIYIYIYQMILRWFIFLIWIVFSCSISFTFLLFLFFHPFDLLTKISDSYFSSYLFSCIVFFSFSKICNIKSARERYTNSWITIHSSFFFFE